MTSHNFLKLPEATNGAFRFQYVNLKRKHERTWFSSKGSMTGELSPLNWSTVLSLKTKRGFKDGPESREEECHLSIGSTNCLWKQEIHPIN